MNGEWAYFKSHFTTEQCNRILLESNNIPFQKANMGVGGEVVDEQYRKSQIKFLQKTDKTFEWLYDELWKLALVANDAWFNFHISNVNYIQLAEYSSEYQGEYKRHHDVFWMNNDPKYHRKLSCVVQLTDPNTYSGGDLEFYNVSESPDKDEIRTQGTVIFFPSFIEHAALPVTEGTRHSLAIWFDGPKWR